MLIIELAVELAVELAMLIMELAVELAVELAMLGVELAYPKAIVPGRSEISMPGACSRSERWTWNAKTITMPIIASHDGSCEMCFDILIIIAFFGSLSGAKSVQRTENVLQYSRDR